MLPLPPGLLRCPVCARTLDHAERTLSCAGGHRFDAARQGYFNLLTGKGSPFDGDTPAMVDARESFLGSGHYDLLREAIVSAVTVAVAGRTPQPGVVLDAGAGTGYYLRALATALPAAFPVALDVSKFALRRAARKMPGSISLVWDIWQALPIADGSVDVLLNVFAPRNPVEFTRVLSKRGLLVVVTPRPGHLDGLEGIGPLLSVPAQKADDVVAAFGTLTEISREHVNYEMELSPDLARSALDMGPAARHPSVQGDDRPPAGSTSIRVQARFTVQVLVRRE